MRRSMTLIFAILVMWFGSAIPNSTPAHGHATTAKSMVAAGHVSSEALAVVSAPWAAFGVVENLGATSAPPKSNIKKETLWLMIGLLASVAIAGLVSAIRRAKKIRED